MNIADVISLAKAGYKKKDIEELLSIEVPEPIETPEPIAEDPQEEKPEQVKEAEPEVDYKKLYEESQEKLRAAQQSNVQQNIGSDIRQSDEDILTDIVKNLR